MERARIMAEMGYTESDMRNPGHDAASDVWMRITLAELGRLR
jgi:hypothetical protein